MTLSLWLDFRGRYATSQSEHPFPTSSIPTKSTFKQRHITTLQLLNSHKSIAGVPACPLSTKSTKSKYCYISDQGSNSGHRVCMPMPRDNIKNSFRAKCNAKFIICFIPKWAIRAERNAFAIWWSVAMMQKLSCCTCVFLSLEKHQKNSRVRISASLSKSFTRWDLLPSKYVSVCLGRYHFLRDSQQSYRSRRRLSASQQSLEESTKIGNELFSP